MCCSSCPIQAQSLSGRKVSVQDICDEIRQDWRMFMQSGGGITCSGGEALIQPEFLHALLVTLHDNLGFHTCLDTTAHAPWEALSSLLPFTDLFLVDIKHMNDHLHRQGTGVGNHTILSNIERLARENATIHVRVPLIPGYNDTNENLEQLARFLDSVNLHHVEIMPYHSFGLSKYAALGRSYIEPQNAMPRLQATVETLCRYQLHVEVYHH